MTLEDIVVGTLRAAALAGARAADAVAVESDGSGVNVRLGEVEKVLEARERRLGLRVFVDQSSAVLSTADLSARSLERLAQDAVACARVTAPDPAAGLPTADELCGAPPDLGLYDSRAEALSTTAKIDLAKRAEAAALEADAAISNSEGAEFSSGAARVAYGNSLGFLGAYEGSSFALHVVPVASRDGGMQRDYWYTAARQFDRLEPAESVGRTAAHRTLRRLGARKVATCRVPVVFDPEAAATLVRHLAAAVSGSAVYRGTSFLRDKLGEPVAAPDFSVHDDGTIAGALGSKPFDGEGLPTRKTVVVDRGVLRSYLLDCYSARKLGLRSTGNASRSIGEAPSVAPTNLFALPGPYAPQAIVASVERGLYVTELIGFGVNPVTGDYSRGAVGLWIERGEFAHPVEEVTIAGNLLDMFRAIDMIGSDLTFRGAISAPTLRIAAMTVAGM
jgi:PmbA protein